MHILCFFLNFLYCLNLHIVSSSSENLSLDLSSFLIGHFVYLGSAITGPIGKECADLWPRIASAANAIV